MAKRAQVRKARFTRSHDLKLKLRIAKKGIAITAFKIRLRGNAGIVEHDVPFSVREKGPYLHISVSVPVALLGLEPPYWDFVAIDGTREEPVEHLCVCAKSMKRKLTCGFLQTVLPDGTVVIPYIASGSKFSLIVRPFEKTDARIYRFKEYLAFVLYHVFKRRLHRKNIWLVFEKFCSRAQDNGFYFFKYCMEQLPESERKRIFYVLDPDSPDSARVAPWKRNVVPFMSVRHMVYALAAEMYVGSDSTAHLYAYRSRSSFIKKKVNRHRIFFLQHGVMGIKRTDDLFGFNGLHPMTYFLTSATREQRIIVENFAYAPENVPVIGLSRWDALEDRRTPEHPVILLMPTWRSWLEDMDEDEFKESAYFQAYTSLTHNPSLLRLLQQNDAVLDFYIHPKFAPFLSAFDSDNDRVRLVSEADRPMNELIMECSLLITDYSSVCWDVLYMGKPVCYYQFDQQRFLQEIGSYLSLDRDLPGPVCEDQDALVRAVAGIIHSGWRADKEYEEKVAAFGLVREPGNCKRTYDFLIEQRKRPGTPKTPRTFGDAVAKVLPNKVANHLMPGRGARVRYVASLKQEPVDEHAILLESRHGDAFEGNMFYIAREMLMNPAYDDWTIYVPAAKNRRRMVKSQVACLPAGQKVNIVTYGSSNYLHALATCKYVMNDTSYLHAFYNRPDQIYVNTWHGTPLKHLGRGVHDEAVRMGNVHRNLLCADYLLFPNQHTADAMFDSYMMRGQFDGEAFFDGYPRNSILFDEERRRSIRDRFGLNGKKVYAFMPTYRGLNKHLDQDHFALTRHHLEVMDAGLADDELMFVNLHPFMAGAVDAEGLDHVFMFPESLPTYDFLGATDGLVTDYSSVFFDYAATGKPIVLFTYDLEEYMADRGVYFNVEETSFTHVHEAQDILPALRSFTPGTYADMQQRFCAYDGRDATKRMLAHVFEGQDNVPLYQPVEHDTREKVLVSIEGIEPTHVRQTLERYFDDPGLKKAHYYVTFTRENDGGFDILDDIGADVDYYAIGGKLPLDLEDRAAVKDYLHGRIKSEEYWRKLDFAFVREWQRRFGDSHFDRIVTLGHFDRLTFALFAHQQVPVTYVLSRTYAHGLPAPQPSDRELKLLEGNTIQEAEQWLSDELRPLRVNRAARCMQLRPRYRGNGHGTIAYHSIVRIKYKFAQQAGDLRIQINPAVAQDADDDASLPPVYLPVRLTRLKGRDAYESGTRWYRLSFELTEEACRHLMPGVNPIMLCFAHDGVVSACCPIFYDMVRRRYRGERSKQSIALQDGTKARFGRNGNGHVSVIIE